MFYLVPAAYLVDLLFGDPPRVTHPVLLQGRLITYLEKRLNNANLSGGTLKILGALTVVIVVSSAAFSTWFLVFLLGRIHPVLGILAAIWLTSTTIAQKGLARCTPPIIKALEAHDLPRARELTAQIVGRDTAHLGQHELVRAVVETVAENTVDAITAPLFFAFLGGAPLAMAYRSVNTLDSMLGHKNERYLHFGWATARLDDLANYIPARLSGVILILAAGLCGLDVRAAAAIMRRDAKLHPSPNSGVTEAGFAGAMGITLGGENYYEGQKSFRTQMGNVRRPLVPQDINTAVGLMQMLSVLFFALCILALGVFK